MQHSAKLRIEANRDSPDTVIVYQMPDQVGHDGQAGHDGQVGHDGQAGHDGQVGHDKTSLPAATGNLERRTAHHTPAVQAVRAKTRKRESFRFDPNTVSVEDLQRLGFSEKQAQSIDNYRQKGGEFRRKEDFAKSYVVADSVYKRLERFIDIPRLDINKADSAAFDALPGIGPYFAAKMVSYREELGGYSSTEQLLEIYNFSEERYERLKDLIVCSTPPRPLRLWTLPEDSLRLHPHIRYRSVAHGIALYRENNPRESWTLEGLLNAGVIDSLTYYRLRLCKLSS